MKISKMTMDQATNAIVRMSKPVSNIMKDSEIESILKDFMARKGKDTNLNVFANLLPGVVAIALETHREDLYEVIGALEQKPAAEIGKTNFLSVVKILRDSVDSDLLDFLKSFGEQGMMNKGE